MATTFNTIFNKFKLDPVQARTKSQAWWENQIKSLGTKPKASALMRNSNANNRGNFIVGNMYMFYYDAKHKDTLPYWDKFPCVFPFSIQSDSVICINFHYLPFGARIFLLDSLLSLNNTKVNSKTQLQLSWATISKVSKLNFAQVCVHKYLLNHIQSPLKWIDPENWSVAINLPVAQFVGNNGKPIRANRIWGSI